MTWPSPGHRRWHMFLIHNQSIITWFWEARASLQVGLPHSQVNVVFHITWSYPSLPPTARFCLVMSPAKSSQPHHHAGLLGVGYEACVLLSEATGRSPKAFGKPGASAWLPCDFSGRHTPAWIAVSSLSLFSTCWHHVGLVLGGLLHPGVQKLFGGVIAAPACGDFLASGAGE